MPTLRRREVLHGILALPAGGLLAGRPTPGLHAAVFNGGELQAALRAAGPGSVIELAPGDYGDAGGRFLVPAASGVRLRARSALHAVLRAPLVVEGDEAEVEGLTLMEGVHLAAAAQNFVGTRVSGIGLKVTGANSSVTSCEFVACSGPGLIIGSNARGTQVRGNWFHDPAGGTLGNAAIQVGTGTGSTNKQLAAQIEGNRIERWKTGSETISVKSSGNTVRSNVLIECKNLTNRHGEGNLYQGNVLDRCDGLVIQDRGNRLIGNVLATSRSIRIMGGNATPDTTTQGLHPQAVGTFLQGNTGRLVVGVLFNGHTLPALSTTIASHNGAIELRAQEGTQLP